jgi:ribose 5-phosphate isomerase B
MRVAIGADHGGFPLKAELVAQIRDAGYQVQDLGSHIFDPVDDYPDFAQAVAQAVAVGQVERGIIVCGSGVGASIAANKVWGVRAATCHDTYSARQGVEHDDMNVLCLGARVVGGEVARELVVAFLAAKFVPNKNYLRRLNKIRAMETASAACRPKSSAR